MGKRLLGILAFLCVISVTFVYAQGTKNWEDVKKASPTLDTDGDGIPDWWELKYGMDPENKFDAKMDFTGEHLNALQKYQIDADPKTANIDQATGVSKDWMKFYKVANVMEMDGKKGITFKDDYDQGLIPHDETSLPVKENEVSQKHPEPRMDGVTANPDTVPDNHLVSPNVWKYLDPIGDDKGPGYYTYPTNPVYVPGAFDLVSFIVDATSPDFIVLKVTVNADLKQDWGMAADFDVQFVQVYIDTDRVPGSGHVDCVPGLQCAFAPDFAWDRCVMISPQPDSRVQIEVDMKAKSMKEDVVVPTKISGQGRTITAVVKKKDLGVMPDTDISKWAWQVVMQSNEGYPIPENVLVREVNEYRGLHRFGGGSDFMGDPQIMDILVWPAKGTIQEAKDQFAILNSWESYPDPKMDVYAVVPLVANDQKEQWKPTQGYSQFAKDMAAKRKPPAQRDKYVSDNFNFSGSVNAQWYYNLDNTTMTVTHPNTFGQGGLNQTFMPNAYYDNHINSRFTLEWYGKCFSDVLNFYARISTWWGADSEWDYWTGNYYRDNHGPQYVSVDFEAFRFQLVQPVPTVDYLSFGNYDVNIDAWTVGAASYPDRDKFKGVFLDGSSDFLGIKYNVSWFYPLPWLGYNWQLGSYTARDNVLAGMIKTEPVKGIKFLVTSMFYDDREFGTLDTNTGLTGDVPRTMNYAGDGDLNLTLKLGDTGLALDLKGGYSYFWRGTNPTTSAPYSGGDIGLPNDTNNFYGYFGVGTVKVDNLFGTGLKLEAQGFYIKDYYSIMAARGDYANAAVQDVLDLFGNQSAHGYPQDAATFQKWDNVMWESAANGGWFGGTGILEWSLGLLNIHGEFSMWGFNNTNFNVLPDLAAYSNGQTFSILTNVYKVDLVNNWYVNTNNIADFVSFAASSMRGYLKAKYKLDIGNGIDITLSCLFDKTRNWWPFAANSMARNGMTGVYQFRYGFDFISLIPKLTLYYQLTKVFRVGCGFEYRNDTIIDLYPGSTNNIFPVKCYTALLDFQYSTPLGTLRSYIQGYMADNPRQVPYGGTTTDFRIPFAYFGNKMDVVALTELDIAF